MVKIITSAFLMGLSFGCGPCLASCGPVLVSYVAGTKKNILKGLQSYCLFSLARISVYLALSLLVFFLGQVVLSNIQNKYHALIFTTAGVLFIFIGLRIAMGKRVRFKQLDFLKSKLTLGDKKSTFLLGLVIGLLPCAPLLMILSYIGLVAKGGLQSLLYAFSFGIGTFVSPAIFLVMASGLLARFSQDETAIYSKVINIICGLIMVFIGFKIINSSL